MEFAVDGGSATPDASYCLRPSELDEKESSSSSKSRDL